jgi:hypothetical protein
MPNLKVYLDTSIINFLYAEDAPEYKKETERFFETVLVPRKIDAFISGVVTGEINDTTKDDKRSVLIDTFNKYPMIQLLDHVTEKEASEIAFLSEIYIDNGIIPANKRADALHIAYSTVFQMDILLSWNFKHLANIHKEQKILIVNKSYGFNYPFRMANPLEVSIYD